MAIVRPATHDDLDALVTLLDDYRVFYRQPSDKRAARDFLSARFSRGDSHLLVHETRDERVTGFVQLYPELSTVSLAPRWILNDLFVAADARSRGVGRALMMATTELAREYDVPRLTLVTQVDNHSARRLHESLGWQRVNDFYSYTLDLTPGEAETP